MDTAVGRVDDWLGNNIASAIMEVESGIVWVAAFTTLGRRTGFSTGETGNAADNLRISSDIVLICRALSCTISKTSLILTIIVSVKPF